MLLEVEEGVDDGVNLLVGEETADLVFDASDDCGEIADTVHFGEDGRHGAVECAARKPMAFVDRDLCHVERKSDGFSGGYDLLCA